MDIKRNRYASILDLNNYFKINDLLSGLTKSQQEALRKNIGVDLDTLLESLQDKIVDLILVDDNLSTTSKNPVQNKVIAQEINDLKELIKVIQNLNASQSLNIETALTKAQEALDKSTEASNGSQQAIKIAQETDAQVDDLEVDVDNLSAQIEQLDEKLENIEISGGAAWVDVH